MVLEHKHSEEDHTKSSIIYDILLLKRPNYSTTQARRNITGVIKAKEQHFNVQELPLFTPDGVPTFLFITVKRKGMTTTEVANTLAKLFTLKKNEVSYAGMKDKQAVVTQTFSIRLHQQTAHEVCPLLTTYNTLDKIKAHWIDIKQKAKKLGLIILTREKEIDTSLNSRRLRKGNLRGNAFKILVTDIKAADDSEMAGKEALEQLRRDIAVTTYLPNYYGEQRVGRYGKHAKEGFKLLKAVQEYVKECGQASAKPTRGGLRKWCRARKRSSEGEPIRKLHFDSFGTFQKVNAFQATIFNTELSWRIEDALFLDRCQQGDTVMSQFGGRLSTHQHQEAPEEGASEDKSALLESLTFALPLIGPRGKPTSHGNQLLAGCGLSAEALKLSGLDGGFRPGRLNVALMKLTISLQVAEPGEGEEVGEALESPGDAESSATTSGIWFEFELPKGAFATSVIRQFIELGYP